MPHLCAVQNGLLHRTRLQEHCSASRLCAAYIEVEIRLKYVLERLKCFRITNVFEFADRL